MEKSSLAEGLIKKLRTAEQPDFIVPASPTETGNGGSTGEPKGTVPTRQIVECLAVLEEVEIEIVLETPKNSSTKEEAEAVERCTKAKPSKVSPAVLN